MSAIRRPRAAHPALLSLALLLAVPLAAPGLAQAQTVAPAAAWSTSGPTDASGQPIPNGNRIGRLGLVEGDARHFAGDAASDRWVAAEPNLPIVSGNSLATNVGSRAEVRIGSLTVALDGDSQADFFLIDDTAIEIGIARGAVAITINAHGTGERFELEAGQVRLAARSAGTYVLRVDSEQRVEAKVVQGQADIKVGVATLPLISGQQARIEPGATLSYRRGDLAWDGFDDWVQQRETAWAAAGGVQYVSPEMTGAEALAEYGNWQQDPALGPIWYPASVTAGWEPYRDGRWVDAPQGPLWVAAAPWGFATGYYGRWQRVDGRWGWMPGAYRARPVAVAPQRPQVAPGRQPQRYPSPGFPAPGNQASGYLSPNYPAPDFPQPGRPNAGYPNAGYPSAGYPSAGYPAPVRPAPSYQPPVAQVPVAPGMRPPGAMQQPAPMQPIAPITPVAPGVGSYPNPPRDYPTPSRQFAQPSRDYPQPPRYEAPARGLAPNTPPGTIIRPQSDPRSSKWRTEPR